LLAFRRSRVLFVRAIEKTRASVTYGYETRFRNPSTKPQFSQQDVQLNELPQASGRWIDRRKKHQKEDDGLNNDSEEEILPWPKAGRGSEAHVGHGIDESCSDRPEITITRDYNVTYEQEGFCKA
jgi:hypothetical protein